MKEMNDVIVESILNYFYELSVNGYKKLSSVDKIIILQFLGELLLGDLRFFINESDYKYISNALYCLYGSDCLIPYPLFLLGQLDGPNYPVTPRVSEITEYRSSTGYPVRIVKQ